MARRSVVACLTGLLVFHVLIAIQHTRHLCFRFLSPDSNSKSTSAESGLYTNVSITTTTTSAPKFTFACFMMATQKDEASALRIREEGWGRYCDHFVIFSNRDDPPHNIVDIHNLPLSKVLWSQTTNTPLASATTKGGEQRVHLSGKAWLAWHYMWSTFPKADFVMKADPDTYMRMDAFRQWLPQQYQPDETAYVGRVFKRRGNLQRQFVTGLSVTLSRHTLHQLGTLLVTKMVEPQHACSFLKFASLQGEDDVALADCLRREGILPNRTHDTLGRERFHHFPPERFQPHPSLITRLWRHWYLDYSFNTAFDSNCCSNESFAFHYVKIEKQIHHPLIYNDVEGLWKYD